MDGTSAVGTALAIADAILKIGKIIYEKYKAYKEALHEIREYFVRFEGSWLKVNDELEILKCIMNSLETPLVKLFESQLTILLEKFSLVSTKLSLVIREDGRVSRTMYAWWLKGPLLRAVDDLEQWMLRFYPSWFATARDLKTGLQSYVSNRNLGQSQSARNLDTLRLALRSSDADARANITFLAIDSLANKNQVTDSCVELATVYDAQSSSLVLIDGTGHTAPGCTFAHDIKDVEKLAAKLSTITDPATFGLLQCKGIIQLKPRDESNRLECSFVFNVPRGLSKPYTLRELLSTQPIPAISNRIKLAKRLARSLMFVQNYEFVHKNMRPETIIIFDGASDKLQDAFLTGFQYLRAVDGQTIFSQQSDWARDIYRHPARQGDRPHARYFMQHDIYSLGVCLLEIGLWSSFVLPISSLTGNLDITGSPRPELPISDLLLLEDQLQKAWRIKDILCEMAEQILPTRMGSIYTNVVLACLSSWEDQESKFGVKSEFQHQDGVAVSVRYLEKVLSPLEEIVV